MRIFLAGATGAVGRRLVPLMIEAGHDVSGTTRSSAKAEGLARAGARPFVLDVFDAAALAQAVAEARPEVVVHQLTDLPYGLDPGRMPEALPRNARLRREGTKNLVAAALRAGARRLIAQSIAWAYAQGPLPHAEDDPLDTDAPGQRGETVRGVAALESAVLGGPSLEGIVLRYGQFYGPGTGVDAAKGPPALHVDAAAQAALLALERGAPGVYNVAEACDLVATDKARRELGWSAAFRCAVTREP